MPQKSWAGPANGEYCNALRLFCDFTKETCVDGGVAGMAGKECQILLARLPMWVVMGWSRPNKTGSIAYRKTYARRPSHEDRYHYWH